MTQTIDTTAILRDVCKMLAENGKHHPTPLKVTIKGTTYNAVRYSDAGRTRYYVLGTLPAHYKRSRRAVYVASNHRQELYIGGYADSDTAENHPKFHKFGAWFDLSLWYSKCKGLDGRKFGKIDRDELKPYERIRITIDKL